MSRETDRLFIGLVPVRGRTVYESAALMKVYVVTNNNIPVAVFSTREAAEAYCKKQEIDLPNPPWAPRTYWLHSEFTVDGQ